MVVRGYRDHVSIKSYPMYMAILGVWVRSLASRSRSSVSLPLHPRGGRFRFSRIGFFLYSLQFIPANNHHSASDVPSGAYAHSVLHGAERFPSA